MIIDSPSLLNHPDFQYLNDIITALEKVDPKYFSWYKHKPANDGTISEVIKKSNEERVFAYELYHQIRKIMDTEPIPDRYIGVHLNGEAIKDDNFFTTLYKGLSTLYDSIKTDICNRKMPDLVLHKDPGSIKKEGQIYLAEIKMGDNAKALNDLLKLTMFENSGLNFDLYIFIYVGKSTDELKNELKKIDVSILSKNIVCACVKHQQAKCYTLGELI